MILEYFRTRGDATPPSRANPSDAGLDVHFSPDDGELKGVYLEPGECKLFSTPAITERSLSTCTT